MKNNILHIIPFAHNGGTETNCVYTMQFDEASNHSLIVLDKEGPMSERFSLYAGDVTYLDALDKGIFSLRKQLKNLLSTKKFDGIIYWSNIHLPIIRNVLDGYPVTLAVHFGNPVVYNSKVLLKNLVLNFIYSSKIQTTIFACSDYVRKSISKDAYYRKFESVFLLNPAAPVVENPYKKNKTNDTFFDIGMVARLDKIKDHKTLILGFSQVIKKHSNCRLHLVGDGVLKTELMELVSQLNLSDYVIFYGNQSDVYSYLQQWDLFAFSTTENEGLGNVVIEALANGLPVLVSDLPMMREILADNEAGEYFKLANAEDLALKIQNTITNKEKLGLKSNLSFNLFQDNFHPKRYIAGLKKILNY